MNNLLNHVAQVFRWILKLYFLKYRRGFSRILLRSLAVIISSIRQITHRKPPFYSSSTKRFSGNGLSTDPLAEALHEQDTVNLKESILYTRDKKRSPSKEMSVKKVFIHLLFLWVLRRLYRFGSWNWKWKNPR